jgi:nicotinamide phosphoribosyltransferase
MQFELNGGDPVASSIPATEHSVMTAWPSEREAIENMIQHYGSGLFSVVMDSYDYAAVKSTFLKQTHAPGIGTCHGLQMPGVAWCRVLLDS